MTETANVLQRALADAQRHPTDMTVVRRLADEMVAAGAKLATALELAPAYLPHRKVADTPDTRTTSAATKSIRVRNPRPHRRRTSDLVGVQQAVGTEELAVRHPAAGSCSAQIVLPVSS